MQPETYKEMERKENTPETEAETFEDMDYSDLKVIGKLAKQRLSNSVKIEMPEPAEPDDSAYINPVSWE